MRKERKVKGKRKARIKKRIKETEKGKGREDLEEVEA